MLLPEALSVAAAVSGLLRYALADCTRTLTLPSSLVPLFQAVLELENRFSYRERGGRGVLLTCDGGNGVLLGGMFSFAASRDDSSVGDNGLQGLLACGKQEQPPDPSKHDAEPLKASAIRIYNWLNSRLEQESRASAAENSAAVAAAAAKASAAAAATAAAANAVFQDAEAKGMAAARQAIASFCLAQQAAWLLGFLETFRCRVHWTTSLATSLLSQADSLALNLFRDANLGSHRVPLSEIDLIKLALVSRITNEVCTGNLLLLPANHLINVGNALRPDGYPFSRRCLKLVLLHHVTSAGVLEIRTERMEKVHQFAANLRCQGCNLYCGAGCQEAIPSVARQWPHFPQRPSGGLRCSHPRLLVSCTCHRGEWVTGLLVGGSEDCR